jgi:hypothetical protein
LFDGGAYQGEIVLFNLAGMEQLNSGSSAFAQEAVRRALSQSELGHVMIQDHRDRDYNDIILRLDGAQRLVSIHACSATATGLDLYTHVVWHVSLKRLIRLACLLQQMGGKAIAKGMREREYAGKP